MMYISMMTFDSIEGIISNHPSDMEACRHPIFNVIVHSGLKLSYTTMTIWMTCFIVYMIMWHCHNCAQALGRIWHIRWHHHVNNCNTPNDVQNKAIDFKTVSIATLTLYIITMTSSWGRWRLKSPPARLFTQPFIQAQMKENIKAPRHWPMCGECTCDRWIPHKNGQ